MAATPDGSVARGETGESLDRSATQRAIHRMIAPRSVAIVGASESTPFFERLLDNADAAGLDLVLVNPRVDKIFTRPTVPSLLDVDIPIDSVLALVGADTAVKVVEQAAAIGAGGVIVTAARFAEIAGEGARREQAIREIASQSGLAICGPNCLGVYNVSESVHLYIGEERRVRRGHVALVSQSGGLLTTLQLSAQERAIGFSHMISTGNEAVTDMVDFLDYLIDDPETTSVALVIEQIRRPQEFLEAVRRARAAGMAILAVKLGRSPGGQRASLSHTGALVADARDYDLAFGQAGIEVVASLDDLIRRVQLFSHLPAAQWKPARKVAVLTASGGVAATAADAFHDAGLELPQDDGITARAAELIPGTLSSNPLDITGVMYNEAGFGQLLDLYLASDTYDTVLVVNYLQERMEAFSAPMLAPLRRAAPHTDKRLIAVAATECAIAPWAQRLLDDGIALGSSLASTVDSLAAMTRLAEQPIRPRRTVDRVEPRPSDTVALGGGELVRFGTAMRLLSESGIPVAPYELWGDSAQPSVARSEGPFVVKLADVAHRTEIGGVKVRIGHRDVPAVANQLRHHAGTLDLPDTIVVQPMLTIERELFLGIQGQSTFGPLVIFGIGGITIEALGDVALRVAPLTLDDAHEMISEIRAARLLDEFRGSPGVDRDQLAKLLVSLGDLAIAASDWLESLDINPLICNAEGMAAVDVSIMVRPSHPQEVTS